MESFLILRRWNSLEIELKKDIKRLKKEKGSYSVEAAFTLTIFIISIISLMSIFNLMKVEGEVRAAINKTAFEISQYSY